VRSVSASGTVPGPQVLHLPGGDHHYGQARGQQRADEHPIAALDRDLDGPVLAQPGDHRGDPGPVMHGAEPAGDPPGHVHHARDMIGAGPVDPGAHPAGRDIGQNLG
jgi:hypothetical protein